MFCKVSLAESVPGTKSGLFGGTGAFPAIFGDPNPTFCMLGRITCVQKAQGMDDP
jgi:hypothetical protein